MRKRTPSIRDVESVHDYGLDAVSRTVFMIGEVTSESASTAIKNLYLLARSPQPIRVVLTSDGGSVGYGWAIYDALRALRNDVTVDGIGAVHSIAALILQGGKHRRMGCNARMLVHYGSMDLGTVHSSELVSLGLEQRRDNFAYSSILARRSRTNQKQISALCAKETWLSAKDALQMGLIDEVIPSR